ncbi:hypothetical protein D3C80_1186360 [compost metagenome]
MAFSQRNGRDDCVDSVLFHPPQITACHCFYPSVSFADFHGFDCLPFVWRKSQQGSVHQQRHCFHRCCFHWAERTSEWFRKSGPGLVLDVHGCHFRGFIRRGLQCDFQIEGNRRNDQHCYLLSDAGTAINRNLVFV